MLPCESTRSNADEASSISLAIRLSGAVHYMFYEFPFVLEFVQLDGGLAHVPEGLDQQGSRVVFVLHTCPILTKKNRKVSEKLCASEE